MPRVAASVAAATARVATHSYTVCALTTLRLRSMHTNSISSPTSAAPFISILSFYSLHRHCVSCHGTPWYSAAYGRRCVSRPPHPPNILATRRCLLPLFEGAKLYLFRLFFKSFNLWLNSRMVGGRKLSRSGHFSLFALKSINSPNSLTLSHTYHENLRTHTYTLHFIRKQNNIISFVW